MREGRLASAAALAMVYCLVAGGSWAADVPEGADPNAPVVNMPDGVQTSPASSVMVVHPDLQCPGTARFHRLSTTYTEWANNKAVSTWTNTTELFVACVDLDPNEPEPEPPP